MARVPAPSREELRTLCSNATTEQLQDECSSVLTEVLHSGNIPKSITDARQREYDLLRAVVVSLHPNTGLNAISNTLEALPELPQYALMKQATHAEAGKRSKELQPTIREVVSLYASRDAVARLVMAIIQKSDEIDAAKKPVEAHTVDDELQFEIDTSPKPSTAAKKKVASSK